MVDLSNLKNIKIPVSESKTTHKLKTIKGENLEQHLTEYVKEFAEVPPDQMLEAIDREVKSMKYNEDKITEDIISYIRSTYGQHYVGKDGVQTIDVWQSMGMEKEVCLGTALKYLMRYGKKDGYNEKDLLKAVHYIILLIYFSRQKD